MSLIELKAHAKINLSLDVTSKRPDGYHEVRMIMQTLALHDTVSIEASGEGIVLVCDFPDVPSDCSNIAYKAASLIMDKCKVKGGVRISIQKRIPVAAGLAGGSADAAAVLKGINSLLSLGLSETELMILGKQIGADVPYCIKGGTMLAEGIGEKLSPLAALKPVNIVLVKPRINVSTAWVYRSLDLGKISEKPDTELLINAVENGDLSVLAKNMKNVLESVTAETYSEIGEAKKRLIELGAEGSMMSGSGPSVFGLFSDKQAAERAYDALKSSEWSCFLTETINQI